MATLSIRNLPDEVHTALRIRAAEKGASMEAEARRIITQACKIRTRKTDFNQLQSLVEQLYGDKKPSGVVDELIADRRTEAGQE